MQVETVAVVVGGADLAARAEEDEMAGCWARGDGIARVRATVISRMM